MARRKKNPLVHAATLLPLAIGLGSNLLTTAPEATRPGGAAGPGIAIVCTLPFASVEQHHPLDDSCPATGASSLGTPQAAQNQAKNNFCASGSPVNIDFDVLHQLQKDVEDKGVSFGSDGSLPHDRSALFHLPTKAGSIGEGTVARLTAFVMDAHYSNVSKGESVNCKTGGKENNDIHIVLGDSSGVTDECLSVTAEMSPHFRPDVWDPDNLNQKNAHMYRFTGQLFFDASHRPCSGGTGSPKRSSLWEIHPVYAVDICMDASNNCKVDSETNWVPFAEASGEVPSETWLRPPDDIGKC